MLVMARYGECSRGRVARPRVTGTRSRTFAKQLTSATKHRGVACQYRRYGASAADAECRVAPPDLVDLEPRSSQAA